MFKTWSCISALLACMVIQSVSFGQSLSTRNIFVTPGDPASSSASLYTTEPLSFAGTITVPAGSTQILAGPAGKYYAIGRTPGEAVGVLTGIFPNLQVSKRLAATRSANRGGTKSRWKPPGGHLPRWLPVDRHRYRHPYFRSRGECGSEPVPQWQLAPTAPRHSS